MNEQQRTDTLDMRWVMSSPCCRTLYVNGALIGSVCQRRDRKPPHAGQVCAVIDGDESQHHFDEVHEAKQFVEAHSLQLIVLIGRPC